MKGRREGEDDKRRRREKQERGGEGGREEEKGFPKSFVVTQTERESADLEKLDLGGACRQSEESLCVHPVLSDGRDALLYHHGNVTLVRSEMLFQVLAKHWLILPVS